MALCLVSRYRKKHSLTHTYSDHQLSFISFLHLLCSIASSLLKLCPWQSFCTNSLQFLFGLLLAPLLTYSIHFSTQLLSSFRNTRLYRRNLFCCNNKVISSNPSLSFSTLLGTVSFTLMPHIHLTILPAEVLPHFLFLHSRSHFHATYYSHVLVIRIL